jgi:magnesium-transporting ATPase (P-type)
MSKDSAGVIFVRVARLWWFWTLASLLHPFSQASQNHHSRATRTKITPALSLLILIPGPYLLDTFIRDECFWCVVVVCLFLEIALDILASLLHPFSQASQNHHSRATRTKITPALSLLILLINVSRDNCKVLPL